MVFFACGDSEADALDLFGLTDGDADTVAEVAEGEAEGTAGSGTGRGDADDTGLASGASGPFPVAEITPDTVPAATTTEAAATIVALRAARRRSARRAESLRAREPATLCFPLPTAGAFPRSGEAPGPPPREPD